VEDSSNLPAVLEESPIPQKYCGSLERDGVRWLLLDSLDKVNVTPGWPTAPEGGGWAAAACRGRELRRAGSSGGQQEAWCNKRIGAGFGNVHFFSRPLGKNRSCCPFVISNLLTYHAATVKTP